MGIVGAMVSMHAGFGVQPSGGGSCRHGYAATHMGAGVGEQMAAVGQRRHGILVEVEVVGTR
eukprot:66231-Chlamydomonas_euryale.AAC.2